MFIHFIRFTVCFYWLGKVSWNPCSFKASSIAVIFFALMWMTAPVYNKTYSPTCIPLSLSDVCGAGWQVQIRTNKLFCILLQLHAETCESSRIHFCAPKFSHLPLPPDAFALKFHAVPEREGPVVRIMKILLICLFSGVYTAYRLFQQIFLHKYQPCSDLNRVQTINYYTSQLKYMSLCMVRICSNQKLKGVGGREQYQTTLRWAKVWAIMFPTCGGWSHETMWVKHNFWGERRGEADLNRRPSAYSKPQPPGQTDS